MKIPNNLIPEAYSFSKKVFEKKLSLKEAQEQFVGDNRINPNSAVDYFNDFKYLMQGKKFARTLNAYSMDYFISNIYKDYGINGLQNALKALKLHIEYYEGLQNTTMHKMREIYEKYSGVQNIDGFQKKTTLGHSHNGYNLKSKTIDRNMDKNKMIRKIKSIIESNDIKYCDVYESKITPSGYTSNLKFFKNGGVCTFLVEDPFLVVKGYYINFDKLLHFYITEGNSIVFTFQGF